MPPKTIEYISGQSSLALGAFEQDKIIIQPMANRLISINGLKLFWEGASDHDLFREIIVKTFGIEVFRIQANGSSDILFDLFSVNDSAVNSSYFEMNPSTVIEARGAIKEIYFDNVNPLEIIFFSSGTITNDALRTWDLQLVAEEVRNIGDNIESV